MKEKKHTLTHPQQFGFKVLDITHLKTAPNDPGKVVVFTMGNEEWYQVGRSESLIDRESFINWLQLCRGEVTTLVIDGTEALQDEMNEFFDLLLETRAV